MLISEPLMLRRDEILALIARLNNNAEIGREIRTGVYEVGHFGSSHFMPGYEHYPTNLAVNSYGVCDGIDNLLAACPELETSPRQFVVALTPVLRANQPPEGGWRWHKWGPYIGTHAQTTEYLYDEPLIEHVYCYLICERGLAGELRP